MFKLCTLTLPKVNQVFDESISWNDESIYFISWQKPRYFLFMVHLISFYSLVYFDLDSLAFFQYSTVVSVNDLSSEAHTFGLLFLLIKQWNGVKNSILFSVIKQMILTLKERIISIEIKYWNKITKSLINKLLVINIFSQVVSYHRFLFAYSSD